MNPTKVKKMPVTRYTSLGRTSGMISHKDGDWVTYKDYQWMEEYANKLVEFGNLPCLPKDLENLREANGHFALENQNLKDEIASLTRLLTDLRKELVLATI